MTYIVEVTDRIVDVRAAVELLVQEFRAERVQIHCPRCKIEGFVYATPVPIPEEYCEFLHVRPAA